MSLEYYKCRRLLQNIVENSMIGPDVQMNGVTDACHVPIDDIDEAIKFLRETKRTMTTSKGE